MLGVYGVCNLKWLQEIKSSGAACRGVKKYGGEVKLNAHVDQVLMERGRATGVLLKSGQVIKTRKVNPRSSKLVKYSQVIKPSKVNPRSSKSLK